MNIYWVFIVWQALFWDSFPCNFILTQVYESGTIIDFILHIIKLRHKEVNLPKISDGARIQT